MGVSDQLRDTTEAREWARQFKKAWWDYSPDVQTMAKWFANAIEAGRRAAATDLDGAETVYRCKNHGGSVFSGDTGECEAAEGMLPPWEFGEDDGQCDPELVVVVPLRAESRVVEIRPADSIDRALAEADRVADDMTVREHNEGGE